MKSHRPIPKLYYVFGENELKFPLPEGHVLQQNKGTQHKKDILHTKYSNKFVGTSLYRTRLSA